MTYPPKQDELEALCADEGHPEFAVIVKSYKRSAFRGHPVQVRCVRCGRRWPVITKDSWIPKEGS